MEWGTWASPNWMNFGLELLNLGPLYEFDLNYEKLHGLNYFWTQYISLIDNWLFKLVLKGLSGHRLDFNRIWRVNAVVWIDKACVI